MQCIFDALDREGDAAGGSTAGASTTTKVVGVGADCHFSRAYENSKLRNRLEVIEGIRGDLESEDVEVPGVIVVGNQSAGKSSVLEAISGINFPRGENTCTRCASIVRLECHPAEAQDDRPYALLSCNDAEQKQALSCAKVSYSYKYRSCITNFFIKANQHYKFYFSC